MRCWRGPANDFTCSWLWRHVWDALRCYRVDKVSLSHKRGLSIHLRLSRRERRENPKYISENGKTHLKKRFPNPAFRGVWMFSNVKNDWCVAWLYNCYHCKALICRANLSTPFRYLLCYVLTHRKFFRNSRSQHIHQNRTFTHVFIAYMRPKVKLALTKPDPTSKMFQKSSSI